MQVYWRWVVTKVPLWLAPNLITFIGFLINVFTTIPVLVLDSNAKGLVSIFWWANAVSPTHTSEFQPEIHKKAVIVCVSIT